MLPNIIQLSVGILLVAASILFLIINIIRTPNNLRGFYGKMFLILAFLAVAGGATLITFGIIGLMN